MRHNHRRSEVPVVMQTTAATPQQSAPVVGAASQQRPKRGQSACSSSEVKPMATAAHPSSTTGGRRRRQQHRATAASHQAHGPQPEKTEGAGDVVAAAAPAPTNAPQKKQRRRRVKPRAQELLRTQSTGPSPHEGPVQMEGEAHFTTCRSAALEDNARPSSSFRSAFPSHPDFPDGNADVALPSVLSPPNKRRASRLSPSLDGSMASTPNHLHSFSVGGTRPSMAQPQREAATAHASPASFVLAAFGPSHGLNATNTQENLGRSSDESRRGLRVEAAEFCPKIYLAAAQNALTQRSMMKAPPPLSFSPGSTTSTAGHTHGRMAKTPTSPSRRHSIATCHDTRPSSSPMVKATSDGLHSFSPDLAAAEHPDLCAERCSSGKNTPGSVHVYSHSGFVMRSPSSNRAPHLHHRTISGTLLLDEGDKDHVRHNRVAVSDWVAKNEDEMIDLLMAAADEAEVEEAPAERFCSGDVFPSGGDLPSLPHAGYRGAFAPSEQSARRRDSESSLSVCGVATPAALHLHVSGRGSMADFPSSDMMFGGSSPDASPVAPMDIAFDHLVDVWEYNSSAYEDSLDDAEMEWIEEQLRANENPEGFFV